jgi:MinD superfamily P-loop ATPase
MVELVIASGKGGTGKTSLVGSLAVLAEKAILVDCDVDAANLHLIINHSILEENDFSSSSRALIIKEKCNLCGICEEKCAFDAINLITDKSETHYRVDPFACEGCGLCYRICPEDAIAFENVISGKWFKSDTEIGPFLHARLGIAEANSGKLVSVLRQRAREISKQLHGEYIIIDGPPGIGCPVIASITGASYLLIVAEPSLSAIHDMKRLADLARHFQIKTGVCINKYDINRELTVKIEAYAAENDIDIHGKIPFDSVFIEAQIKGKPYIAVAHNEGKQVIKDIWENVNEKLKSIENGLLNKKAV